MIALRLYESECTCDLYGFNLMYNIHCILSYFCLNSPLYVNTGAIIKRDLRMSDKNDRC